MSVKDREPELALEVIHRQLERIARRERGRLVALLVGKLGPARLEMAEDVVQDAIIAAMASWPYKGMPDNPGGWLNRVARNKAYDRLRKRGASNLGWTNWSAPKALTSKTTRKIEPTTIPSAKCLVPV